MTMRMKLAAASSTSSFITAQQVIFKRSAMVQERGLIADEPHQARPFVSMSTLIQTANQSAKPSNLARANGHKCVSKTGLAFRY